jgi:Protein of unknown function (DUF2510)
LGLLDRFRSPRLSAPNTRADWAAAGVWRDWPAPHNLVVGESHYQSHIRTLAGQPSEVGWCVPVPVVITRDFHNKYDENAWTASVNGGLVGHLRRDVAEAMVVACDPADCKSFTVPGVVRGGWLDAELFGVHVWLDRLLSPGPEVHLDNPDTEVSWPPGDNERAAPAAAVAGWYADPAGQGLRWWDGTRWTEHLRR